MIKKECATCGADFLVKPYRATTALYCSNSCSKIAPLAGVRFGKLLVLFRAPDSHGLMWQAQCDCGTVREFRGAALRNGTTRSCGCAHNPRNTTHSQSRSPTYASWRAMRDRCQRRSAANFRLYGGRGITVCERWETYENFLEDMGPRPSRKHSIDRIDNDGNYEPGNCRWATTHEQSLNRSTNLELTHDGRTQTLGVWAKEFGIGRATLRNRLRKGEPMSEASRPVTRSR